jgi:hypothetical protein
MNTDKIDGTLTTDEMFLEEARRWATGVVSKMRANTARFQHGKESARAYTVRSRNRRTGATSDATVKEKVLSKSINYKIKKNKQGAVARVAFDFPLHGIFRAYGVGAGQPGEGTGKKRAPKVRIKRSMSDWANQPIEQEYEKLANIAAHYYGDKLLANVWGINFKKTGTK